MKMNKTLLLGAVAITAIAGVTYFGMPQVAAYRGDMTKVGPYHTEEREAALEKVMKNKDFAGWKKLMTENGRTPGVLSKIDTQSEFDKFAQAWILSKEGKTAEAAKLRAELGLGQGSRGSGKGQGQGRNGAGFVDTNKDGVCDRME
ncbi:MAG: hypothetical protein ACOYT9_03165 [Patescibacteria group bacterium]